MLAPNTGGIRSYQVPSEGLIASWATNAGSGAGQEMTMKIFRRVPETTDTYRVIAHDGPRALKANSFNSFPTSIPVLPGDYVGLGVSPGSKTSPTACFYITGPETDLLALAETQTPDGGTVQIPTLASGGRPNIAAMLIPRPTVSSLAPNAGSLQGGARVTIRGTGFEGAAEVSFGGRPSPHFAVLSDTEILAAAPPAPGISTVDVTVKIAGLESAPDSARFTYQEIATWAADQPEIDPGQGKSLCVVPRLSGKKLRAVRKALKRARCSLGLVSGPRTGRAKAKVRRQKPRPGRLLGGGSSVDVVLRLPRGR